MHCHIMVYVRIVLTTLVTLTCLLGDNFVELTQHPVLRALADNATHAVIGAITGIAFSVHFYERTTHMFGWFLIFVCFAVSSLIDVDHFIEARSWNLEQASNLSRRPFLHCSSIIIVLLLVYVTCALMNFFKCSLLLAVLLAAFITHHTRDAIRHGYWLYPYGHTQRVPHLAYILLTIATPYMLVYIYALCRSALVQKYVAKLLLNNRKNLISNGYFYEPLSV